MFKYCRLFAHSVLQNVFSIAKRPNTVKSFRKSSGIRALRISIIQVLLCVKVNASRVQQRFIRIGGCNNIVLQNDLINILGHANGTLLLLQNEN